MATTIQIKRSPNVAAPQVVDLLEGELAYSYDKTGNGASANLYVAVQDSSGNPVLHTIGGKYYTSAVEAATSTNTVNTLVRRDSLGSISANVITANSFVGNVTASSAQKLTTPRYINLGGDLQGNILFDGTQDVTIVANVISNSVALGTDTTGDYVANITAGTGVTLSGQAGETSNITVSIGQAVGTSADVTFNTVTSRLYGQANTATSLQTGRYIVLSGDVAGSAYFDGTGNAEISATVVQANSVALGTDTTGNYVGNVLAGNGIIVSGTTGENWTPNLTLSATGVTASTYGSTTNIPVFTVDQWGRITSATNAAVSTSFTLAANAGNTDTLNGGDTLRIAGSTGINTVVSDNTFTIFNTGVTSLSGTSNQISVSASNASVQLSLPDNVTINRDLSVAGNLYVSGNVVALPVETLVINDPLIQLANTNVSADIVDIGFYGSYGPGNDASHFHTGLFRDHSDGKYKLFKGLTEPPTTTVNTSGNNYSIASLVANIVGSTVSGLTANILVGDGGTGRGTFTSNGVVFGNAAGALRVTSAGTYGQVLQAGSDGTPVFGGIDGGTY